MPLTSKGEEILANMRKQYGAERGERVFYASKNKGTISGVDRDDAMTHEEVDARIKKFKRALQNREITAKEYEALLEGLSKVASKKDGVDRDDAFEGMSSAGTRRMKFGDVRIEEKGDKFVVRGKEYATYEEAKRAAQAARGDVDPPIPADYATKLDAVDRAMVRLGSRMDALCANRSDAGVAHVATVNAYPNKFDKFSGAVLNKETREVVRETNFGSLDEARNWCKKKAWDMMGGDVTFAAMNRKGEYYANVWKMVGRGDSDVEAERRGTVIRGRRELPR